MKKLSQKHILDGINQNKDKIKALGVKKIILFGSFAKNNQNNLSDIDFIVEFEDRIENKTTMLLELSILLEELFNRDIDVGIKENIKKDYIDSIFDKTIECII